MTKRVQIQYTGDSKNRKEVFRWNDEQLKYAKSKKDIYRTVKVLD